MDGLDYSQGNSSGASQPSIWQWRLRHLLVSLVVVGMGIVFLFVLGQQHSLACSRINANQFDCTIRSAWFGLIPAGERPVRHLQSAQVGFSCFQTTNCTYRVELVLESSIEPLVIGYTLYGEVKAAIANQINRYIQDPERQTFTATDGFNSFFLVIPAVFILTGFYFLIRRWH